MGVNTDEKKAGGGLHVAIIMDGSGRWALARGLARSAGHRLGMKAVERIVRTAPGLGIGTLTLFAFSCDNWRRPECEVAELMRVFEDYLTSLAEVAPALGIRVRVIGRRDRFPASLLAAIQEAESASRSGRALLLRLAIDYSGRDAILRAAERLRESPEASREAFARLLAEEEHGDLPPSDIDLLIRTGGELRLSDCPLWEIAYAELLFTKCLWPDFDVADLDAAVQEFRTRHRRFGRLPALV